MKLERCRGSGNVLRAMHRSSFSFFGFSCVSFGLFLAFFTCFNCVASFSWTMGWHVVFFLYQLVLNFFLFFCRVYDLSLAPAESWGFGSTVSLTLSFPFIIIWNFTAALWVTWASLWRFWWGLWQWASGAGRGRLSVVLAGWFAKMIAHHFFSCYCLYPFSCFKVAGP